MRKNPTQASTLTGESGGGTCTGQQLQQPQDAGAQGFRGSLGGLVGQLEGVTMGESGRGGREKECSGEKGEMETVDSDYGKMGNFQFQNYFFEMLFTCHKIHLLKLQIQCHLVHPQAYATITGI